MRDNAGRHVKYFKGRRNGFMPEYVDHPVKDKKSWEELCLWRLDPKTPERIKNTTQNAINSSIARNNGMSIKVYLVGGYMYLRSLIGPLEIMYLSYDNPELIHECMKAWLELCSVTLGIYQKYTEIDIVLFDEDICYKNSSLISPSMIREFLFPYYNQLICEINTGNKSGKPKIELATDGFTPSVMDLYISCGFNYFSPFEVAAGCDIVEIGNKYPDILLTGGIDKRILASDIESIDRMCKSIFPFMSKRGGYFPTCDHGVPEEVPFENYLHYRKRCLEY